MIVLGFVYDQLRLYNERIHVNSVDMKPSFLQRQTSQIFTLWAQIIFVYQVLLMAVAFLQAQTA
jgi:hypothetical protein